MPVDNAITIRPETSADVETITAVTRAAFASLEISNHTEQYIGEALRAAGGLTVSLVAEHDGRVVGHIAFSPVTITDGTSGWYGLGPVSVLPDYQGRGIGAALIWEGLERLKRLGANGCCLVGHPDYYPRFGFDHPADLVIDGVPPEVFFVQPFDGPVPRGRVTFHEAFGATGPAEPPT